MRLVEWVVTHFCRRQDRRVFKRAQLRAGCSDKDLQTQIPTTTPGQQL